jgi:hypothetical protein
MLRRQVPPARRSRNWQGFQAALKPLESRPLTSDQLVPLGEIDQESDSFGYRRIPEPINTDISQEKEF